MSSAGSSGTEVSLKHIGKEEMQSLVTQYEEHGREETKMLIIDVRNPDEISYTGKVSPNTVTLPLPALMQHNLFEKDEEEWEDLVGIPKPDLDETLIFTCAAGIRSIHAAKFAAASGYSKLVNYVGGANEWFYPG
eukprot:CAMPEP_0194032054 /NCGR_PEP_ID=MMETSP0009_2-20130614/5084_1 /TAXON_ID=210454 /ORGANISM="Grammatophora oceanica, Strain CCMP 410" /LENGTH=134 /DNA_ID=CAMNT_0038672375 /DNA_START=181 /DNA_END=585 /DNA_ORIENTATION=+